MSSNNTGYIFTLNQDIFFERYLYNAHGNFGLYPAIPGIQGKYGLSLFPLSVGPYDNDITLCPQNETDFSKNCALNTQIGSLNIIKLHGSFNWRTSENRQSLMVAGTEKSSQISRFPLLAWYSEIFRRVLTSGDMRLMIMGYGFGDEHINAVIADAVEHHGLRVFIWNVDSNLKQRILSSHCGPSIWKGLLGVATQKMLDVFPSNQAETEEYLRIQQSFVSAP